jgi:hypothetical protein
VPKELPLGISELRGQTRLNYLVGDGERSEDNMKVQLYSVATFTNSSIFSNFASFSSVLNHSVIYSSYLTFFIISLINSETTISLENLTKPSKISLNTKSDFFAAGFNSSTSSIFSNI